MFPRFRVAPQWVTAGAGAVLLIALGGGCQPTPGAGEVVLQPPAAWRPAPTDGVRVPGTPIRAWTGPEGASLVVYRALPIPGASAKSVADELANRISNLPELTVVARGTETWNGHEAARVEAIAPGTGDALAPSGTGIPVVPKRRQLLPTHRVAFGFPTETETLWIAWHYPETAHAVVAPQIEATMKSLRLSPAGWAGY
jgi:hypothetical protein